MELQLVAALAIFASYFIIILALLALVLTSLYTTRSSLLTVKAATFTLLAIGSFAHTWFYMFKYMAWSFANFEASHQIVEGSDLLQRVATWLCNTSLFKEAWSTVCFHPINWWWSEQLCLFTVGAWTVFIAVEGNRYDIKHLWAYMLLGQIVAISVASNLFYLALILRPKPPRNGGALNMKASPELWISILLSLVTIAITPFISRSLFLPNLLVMHSLLFVPIMRSTAALSYDHSSPFSMGIKSLYHLIHLTAAAIHIRTVVAAALFMNHMGRDNPTTIQLFTTAWNVLHSHPAQSSIGWDLMWTSVSFIIWIISRQLEPSNLPKAQSLIYLFLVTPLASVGVAAPYILQPRISSLKDYKDN